LSVIPAEAGIYFYAANLDPRFRGGDESGINRTLLRSVIPRKRESVAIPTLLDALRIPAFAGMTRACHCA